IDLLKDDSGTVRHTAAGALGRIGPEAKAAVPALTNLLKDHDDRVRDAAAWALGLMGPESKAAVPTLTDALNHFLGLTFGVNHFGVPWGVAQVQFALAVSGESERAEIAMIGPSTLRSVADD